MNPVYEKLQKCYESYKAKIDFTPKVALVLGSGLGDYADDIRVVDTTSRASRYRPFRDIRDVLSSDMLEKFRWCACREEFIIMKDMTCRMLCFRHV